MDSVLTEIKWISLNLFKCSLLKFSKKSLIAVLVFFFSLIGNVSWGQVLLAGWDFQTTTNGGTAVAAAPSCPTTLTANFGSGSLFLNGTNGSSTWITATSGNELTAFGGTAVNAGTGFSTVTTAPSCIAFVGGTSLSANGKFAVFKFSMTGYQNLIVSYAAQKTSTGFASHVWEYSTNGTTWTAAQTITTIPTSFGATTLTAITGLDNSSVAYLRLTLTGATNATGNNRIDNIQFTATTITSNYTLSYNGNTNTSGAVPSSSSYSSGATATVSGNTGTLVKTGYTFAGWNTAANGSGTSYAAGATFTISANTTLYAQWTPNNNTITFDANGGTGTMSAQTIATAATATLSTNTFSNTGFSFSGWNTLANGTGTAYANGASYTMGTANVTLYAQWTSVSTPLCPNSSSVLPSTSQTICQEIAASSLSVTVTNSGSTGSPTLSYQWYYNTTNSNTISGATILTGATSSSYLPLSTASEVGTRYYFCVAYATNNGCGQTNATQSLASNAVMVTVNAIPATPTGTATQNFCSGINPSFTSIFAAGTAITWYNASTGGTVQSGVLPVGSNNFYATQTVSGCESSTRLQVSVTVTATPSAPTISSPQSFCNGTSPMVSNLTATGNSIQWYSASTGGTALAANTSLTNGSVYYASQTSAAGGCESLRSTGVTATIFSSLNYGTTAVISTVNHLVISQVYGGGGNATATYTNDFVELFNPTGNTISLSGWSVQYQAQSSTTWNVAANLSGSVAPGKYYLIQLASGGAVGATLPTPDFSSGVINLSATQGKVALVNSTTILTSCTDVSIVDKVAYGTTSVVCNETTNAIAPASTNNQAAIRANGGCTDTDNNNTDFYAGTPTPRNSATPAITCGLNSQTICSGTAPKPMFVYGAYGSGSFTYQWYYQNGSVAAPTGSSTTGWTSLGTTEGANSSIYSPISGITGTRTYACLVTPSGTPTCSSVTSWASGVVVVNIINVPSAPVFTSSTNTNNNITPCVGTTVTYAVSALADATGYTWALPSGWTLVSGANTNSISVTIGSTSGNVTVTPTNSCGGSNSVSLAVTVNTIPSTVPVATAGTLIGSNGFTVNWNPVANATGYYFDLYYYLTDTAIAKWTFPTLGTILTPDVANAANTTSTLSTLGGASAIGDATGSSTKAAFATGWDAGSAIKAWQVVVNTSGTTTLKLSSKQYSSATGPRDFKVQYKIGAGGTWTDITGGTITVGTNFTSGVLNNLVLPVACENQPAVYLQWVMTSNTSVNLGTVASTGTSRIDSITIVGTTKAYVPGYQNYYTTNTSEELAGLSPLTTYYYVVRATFACGTTSNSNEIAVTTTAPCVPTAIISSFSPTTGPVGTWVTITGSGFTAATSVRFGIISAASFTIISDTKIIAKVPVNATTEKIRINVAGCEALSSSNFILISQSGCGNVNSGSVTDLFISEIYDAEFGSLSYIELFNGTASTINLTTGNYAIRIMTSATTIVDVPLSGTVASGAVFVIRLGDNIINAATDCGNIYNQTSPAGGFNGNDRIYLRKGTTNIDYVPNPDYGSATSNPGFNQARTATAVGPTMTYNVNDWIISSTESCATIGIPPYSINSTTISISSQPTDVNCGVLSFSVTATSNPSPVGSYLWKYFNTTTGVWENASLLAGATNTNTATMTFTGVTSQYLDYQFYCVITKSTCEVNTNAVQYSLSTKRFYRNKASGNWTDPSIWEMSNSATDWSFASPACNYPISSNSSSVTIESPYIVTQDIDIPIDYLEIKNGARLITPTTSQLTVSDSVVGPDFIVNGIWEYNSDAANSFQFSDTVTTGRWQLGASATIIKTNGGSSSILRDKYEGGMSTIPATANWIIRYLGADVTFTSSNTFYPNLTMESNSGLWSPTISSSRFTGGSFVTVKGNMDVGGTGTGTVVVFNETTNTQPFLINGNLTVRNGNTFTNAGNNNGTGVEVKGNLAIDGTGVLTTNAGNGVLNITGAAAQNISGTGILNVRKLFVSNTAPLGQNVTISKDISIPDTLQITQGFVDAGITTLNGAAKLIMSGGSLQVSKNGTLLPELTGAYQLSGGTVIFNGNGVGVNAQTIRPVNYFNLTSLNTGDRIMPSGITDTVGIANVFSRGTNVFTFTGSTVNYNGASAQNIASFTASTTPGKTYNNLVLSNAGVKSLGGAVDVEGLLSLKDNVSFALGDLDLTLKSSLSRTASVDKIPTSTSIMYGNGRFVVERYIPVGINHGKSWQLLAVPTNGGQTVKQAWQEGATIPNQNLVPGYGTQLTSNLSGAVGLGFDVYTAPGPSIKTFASGLWNGIPNTTTTPIYNPNGYMIFIRGSRSDTTYNATASATILRTRGKIFDPIGNPPPSITVTPNGYTSIGNPYASAIDFTQFSLSGPGVPDVDNVFWVWDPLLGGAYGYGGYQMISSNNGDFFPTPGGTLNYPSGVRCAQIQSGQAFLMHSTLPGVGGTFNFNENNKVIGSSNTFRQVANQNNQYLRMSLQSNAASNNRMIDGVVVVFNSRYSNDLDYNDALKMPNTNENLSIIKNGTKLSLEARKNIIKGDTIFLCVTNLRRQDYQLAFAPDNFSRSGINAKLVDKFLNTIQDISSSDSTKILFSVTTEVGSYASDRFYIVLNGRLNNNLPVVISDPRAETARTLSISPNENSIASRIYIAPNPVINKKLNLFTDNLKQGTYKLLISDAIGRLVFNKEVFINTANQKLVIDIDKTLPSGIYNLEISGHAVSKNIQFKLR